MIADDPSTLQSLSFPLHWQPAVRCNLPLLDMHVDECSHEGRASSPFVQLYFRDVIHPVVYAIIDSQRFESVQV